jgi:phosphopantothenoylcysteine decarboxylase/phosphopantothenate--cysteine ligase
MLMRIIVTAGPTREYLDDVRFLSNASSGRMGYAVARAAAKAGHAVDLVSGPVALKAPPGVRVTRVTTTREMYAAVRERFPGCDALVGAAAPVDYRPARRVKGKRTKQSAPLALTLNPTVDILAAMGRRKGRRVVVAFALEVRNARANALKKMKRKRADAVVLNAPAAMDAARQDATLIRADGTVEDFTNTTKARIAKRIVNVVEDFTRKAARAKRKGNPPRGAKAERRGKK